ncbi:proton (H+) antiporter-1 domain protein [Mycobacterium xenopi 4042]|uniref:Proton (H+) antiporter-1 domain protein n=1 Tax=Mycobacterium xenopi 4042 TaxID=1299334 RepID=X8DEC6_MYCXE|nr:proton (H+) antiporter-1 domain protein [Mycobacterium xenopi 4042]
MHCSGVVAVLVAALVLSYVGPRVIRARSRLQSFAFWDMSTFLINGSLWVFVGSRSRERCAGFRTSTAGFATPRCWRWR